MQQLGSTRNGYALAAGDDAIGHVGDFLFDGRHLPVRSLALDTNSRPTVRRVFIHVSAIQQSEDARETIQVGQTMAQRKTGPGNAVGEPVSQQMEVNLYSCCGSNPLPGGGYLDRNTIATQFSTLSGCGLNTILEAEDDCIDPTERDPHQHDLVDLPGYHLDVCANLIAGGSRGSA
jgi:hypothetical protein